MFKVIFHTLINYKLLAQVLLLKKSIIYKLMIFLTFILTLPTIFSSIQEYQQLKNEISLFTQHLPDYNTLLSNSNNTAIQTDNIYFLNMPQPVSETIQQKIKSENTFSFFMTDDTVAFYMLDINVDNISLSANAIQSQEDFIQQLTKLLSSLTLSIPIYKVLLDFILNFFTVIFNNIFFSFLAFHFFLFKHINIKFEHLQRASLFFALIPYVILSALQIFNIFVPYALFMMTIFIIYMHYKLIKTIIPPQR